MASGTITDSAADDEEWKSQTYVIEVREGVPYSFELTGLDYNTVGIWNSEAQGYIVEFNLIVTTCSATFIFERRRVPETVPPEPEIRRSVTFHFQGGGPLGLPEVAEEGPDLFGQ